MEEMDWNGILNEISTNGIFACSSETCVCLPLSEGNSKIYFCRPWEGVFLWANSISEQHIPYRAIPDHQFVTINYCLSGRCEVGLPDDRYIYMNPGLFCIDGHEPKDGYWYPGGSYEGVEIVLDMASFRQNPPPVLASFGIDAEWLNGCNSTYLSAFDDECRALLLKLYDGLQSGDWPMKDYRFDTLTLLYRITNSQSDTVNTVFVTKGQRSIAEEVEAKMAGNLREHYVIEDLAAEYGISGSALKKYFTLVYGMPISIYLREKRMALAQQLLAETKRSVGEIAAECGYVNQGKFGAAFRKYVGTSPLEYRRIEFHKTNKGR